MAITRGLEFRKAEITSLDEIISMYKETINDMDRKGIPQWDDVYPDRNTIMADINKGEMYVVRRNGELAAAYTINTECDEEYKYGDWRFPHYSYIVVHRLCVNPSFQGQGLGTAIMGHLEEWAVEHSVQSIRLDCFTRNPYAFRMYRKLGYGVTGVVTWRKGDFYLMEKAVGHDNAESPQ